MKSLHPVDVTSSTDSDDTNGSTNNSWDDTSADESVSVRVEPVTCPITTYENASAAHHPANESVTINEDSKPELQLTSP